MTSSLFIAATKLAFACQCLITLFSCARTKILSREGEGGRKLYFEARFLTILIEDGPRCRLVSECGLEVGSR